MEFSTKLLHGDAVVKYPNGATLPPISQVSAFAYTSPQEHEKVFNGSESGYAYTRILNPTVEALENRLCELEGGRHAVAFASGMAAISGLFFCLLSAGDEVIAPSTMYGGTVEFLSALRNLGIHIKFVKNSSVEEIEPLITEHTKIIYGEVIGNPSLDVMDIQALAQLAHEHNIPLAVDSTTASPYLVNPISYGADFVIHSTSKYIDGSSNSIGGILIEAGTFSWDYERYPALARFAGPDAFYKRLRSDILENFGGCMSPMNAYLTIVGLETLSVRMERACKNAQYMAEQLSKEPGITVNYPTLVGHDQEILKKQFHGKGGAILTIRTGSKENAYKVLNNLKYVQIVSNIGDVRTLAVHPATTIFATGTTEQKIAAGIYDDTIRISVGIEDADDLVADFLGAIRSLKAEG